ncbi:MAG: diguanylate cyclase [Nitrospirota bacterium]
MKFPIPPPILNALTPHRLFSRLNISSKMLLGYTTLVVLAVIVVAYALVSLQRINSLTKGIIKGDIAVREASENMLDALLAQDAYEKRYLILRRDDMRTLFWKRAEEFEKWLSALKELPGRDRLLIRKIDRLRREYNDLFMKEIKLIQRGDDAGASNISNSDLKERGERLLEILRTMSAKARTSQDVNMKQISSIGGSAFLTTAALCVLIILAGAAASMVVTHHISSSINRLKLATVRVAEGDFEYDPQINTEDEIGGLSRSFISMSKRLKMFEEMYLDASPLTRLPGGIAIESALLKRLKSGQPMACCVVDLDNFKAFNDRYGYAHGNVAIKEAARIIEAAVKAKGASGDFVGHVGGDDFVVVTTPDLMREISEEIITQFDRRIPQLYDQADRKKGYIRGKTRQGVKMRFPLMTISIAIVTNQHRKLKNPLQVSEIAAELKDHAKTIARSVYVVDKRRAE